MARYHDDPIEVAPVTSGKISGFFKLAFLLVVGSLFLQNTLAANISLGSNAPIEFGQGVQKTVACDSDGITVLPQAGFINVARGGSYGLSSIVVSGVDRSLSACAGKAFTFKAFGGTSSAPLDLVSAVSSVVVNVASGSPQFSIPTTSGVTLSNLGNTGFTINFNSANSPVSTANVYRITVESAEAVAEATYLVGDTGPAGGLIFYVANTPFACGPTLNLSCTYLEAAPKTWSGGATDGTGKWCNDDALIAGTGTAIGTGRANTNIIATNCAGASITKTLQTLTLGGKTDWFLPSSGEAYEFFVQKLLFTGNFALSGDLVDTDPARYLTSSQDRSPGTPSNMQYMRWTSGGIEGGWKVYAGFTVRPIRAF